MNYLKYFFVLVFFVYLNPSFSDDSSQGCKLINWRDGQVYTIKVSRSLGLHIMLPSKLAGNPIPRNENLWDTTGAGNHVFIAPNNTKKEGFQTSLTLIDDNNNSYTFVLKRATSDASEVCVEINKGYQFFSDKDKNAYSNLASQGGAMEKVLRQNNEQLKDQVKSIQESRVKEIDRALNKFKSKIFTGYSWNNKGKDVYVLDVYDDGRFTYIRLNNTAIGMLPAVGVINGKEEVLDLMADPNNNLYWVSGIYDALILKYDGIRVEITRDSEGGHYGTANITSASPNSSVYEWSK